MPTLRTLALALPALLGSALVAAVSPEEAARLDKDLTPVGAERAGNAAGTIPAWTGGVTEAVSVAPGDAISVRFQDLGTVSMRFT